MTRMIARANFGGLKSVTLCPMGDVGVDGYSTSREGYRLIESTSNEVVFSDFIFSRFISLSHGNRFALLVQDRRGRDPVYDLNVLELRTGVLLSLHTLGRGQSSLKKVEWKSDSDVEYEANIVNAEFRAEVSTLTTVSVGTIELRLLGSGEQLKPVMKFSAR